MTFKDDGDDDDVDAAAADNGDDDYFLPLSPVKERLSAYRREIFLIIYDQLSHMQSKYRLSSNYSVLD